MLGDYIREYRKSHALSQNDLGIILGVTKVTISNIENYKIKVGTRTLKSISLKLNIDILEAVKLNENNKQV